MSYDLRDPLNPNALRPYYHTNHRRPMTRRELVGQGFMYGTAALGAPSLLGMFALRTPEAMAAAAECGVAAAAGASGLPYISLELAGGWKAAMKNFLVGKEGDPTDTAGMTDAAFSRSGLDPAAKYDASNTNVLLDANGQHMFGFPMHVNSQFAAGMMSKTSAECRAAMNGGTITCTTENDNGNTTQNPQFLMAKVQQGQFVQGAATRNGKGGRHQSVEANAANAPVQVTNPDQAMALLDAGKAGEIFGAGQSAALEATLALSKLRSNKISAQDATKIIMNCAYDVSKDQALANGDPQILNANADPDAVGANGVFTQNEVDSDNNKRAMASIMKMVVGGYAGTGTCEMGGYDYHGQGTNTQNEKDFEAGEIAGAAFEYAFRKNTPLMIAITSDGSCSARGNTGNNLGHIALTNDNSATSMTAWLVVNPGGRPEATPFQQVGGFDVNGNAITTSGATGNEIGLCDTIFLNWLALQGKEGMFSQLQTNSPLGTNLASYISLAQLTQFSAPNFKANRLQLAY